MRRIQGSGIIVKEEEAVREREDSRAVGVSPWAVGNSFTITGRQKEEQRHGGNLESCLGQEELEMLIQFHVQDGCWV